jgi:SAM-dependent methyltransferase
MTAHSQAADFPPNVEFRVGNSDELPYPDGTFDVVIAAWVFEHFADFPATIREVERVMKVGGVLHMSVPHCRSVEDHLYRAIFAGGGHLQRPTFEGVMHHVYRHSGLKLLTYADWPAGFTFIRAQAAMRAFTLAVMDSLKEGAGQELRLRSNYVFLFRRESTAGFREFDVTCGRCGGGSHVDPRQVNAGWRCPICGEPEHARRITLRDRAELESEMKRIWKRRPWIFAMSYGRAALPERLLARLQRALGLIRYRRLGKKGSRQTRRSDG